MVMPGAPTMIPSKPKETVELLPMPDAPAGTAHEIGFVGLATIIVSTIALPASAVTWVER